MTNEERAKAILAHIEVKRAGYAGMKVGTPDAGMLADRRDYAVDDPGVIPVPANTLLGIPEPRCVACGKIITPTHYLPYHSSCPHTPCDGDCNCG